MDYEQEGSREVWIMSERGVKRNMDYEREKSRKVWIMSERGQEKYGL